MPGLLNVPKMLAKWRKISRGGGGGARAPKDPSGYVAELPGYNLKERVSWWTKVWYSDKRTHEFLFIKACSTHFVHSSWKNFLDELLPSTSSYFPLYCLDCVWIYDKKKVLNFSLSLYFYKIEIIKAQANRIILIVKT